MNNPLIEEMHKGWKNYQDHLVKAVAPLTAEQLALQISPKLRSVMTIAAHIIVARVWWLHYVLGEGSEELRQMADWDEEGSMHTAVELVAGLEATWEVLESGLMRWSTADLNQAFAYEGRYGKSDRTRKWVLWHLLEHDLHHGGELSFVLGAHGLPAIDL